MTSTYAPTPTYPRYRWVVLTSWMLPHLWSFVFLSSLGLMLPSIREELGLTGIQEGLLGGASQLANILLAVPFGWFLSRFNPKHITTISLFCAATFIFFQAWAPFYILLLLGRFLYGVTAVAREPAWVMLIRRWVPPREIVIANTMGNFMWGFVALGIMAVPLLIRILDDSWRNASYVIGLSLLVLNFGWLFLGRDGKDLETAVQAPTERINPFAIVRRHKELWLLAFGMFGHGINFTGFSTFWPSFRLDHFGMSELESSVVMGIGGLFTSFTGLSVGLYVSRKGGKRTVLMLSGIILAASEMGSALGRALVDPGTVICGSKPRVDLLSRRHHHPLRTPGHQAPGNRRRHLRPLHVPVGWRLLWPDHLRRYPGHHFGRPLGHLDHQHGAPVHDRRRSLALQEVEFTPIG